MTKKLLITLSILTLFANCTKASDNNSATHDEGVVINGIRWATRNVDMPGTFAETPESFGMLFQWNRRKAWNAVDEDVEGWDSSIPEGTKWYAENDPCPEGWRVPTREELESLHSVGNVWRIRGVRGSLFGDRYNQVFLPATNTRRSSNGREESLFGTYWSSTPYYGRFAYFLFFARHTVWHHRNSFENFVESRIVGSGIRSHGHSVRCVAK